MCRTIQLCQKLTWAAKWQWNGNDAVTGLDFLLSCKKGLGFITLPHPRGGLPGGLLDRFQRVGSKRAGSSAGSHGTYRTYCAHGTMYTQRALRREGAYNAHRTHAAHVR